MEIRLCTEGVLSVTSNVTHWHSDTHTHAHYTVTFCTFFWSNSIRMDNKNKLRANGKFKNRENLLIDIKHQCNTCSYHDLLIANFNSNRIKAICLNFYFKYWHSAVVNWQIINLVLIQVVQMRQINISF